MCLFVCVQWVPKTTFLFNDSPEGLTELREVDILPATVQYCEQKRTEISEGERA